MSDPVQEEFSILRLGNHHMATRAKQRAKEERDDWVKEQIKLLGSKDIYNIVDKTMKQIGFNKFLINKQFMLYEWRENFFLKHLGLINEDLKFEEMIWYTDGLDDSHVLDTIPLQIATNFDKIMDIAYMSRKGKKFKKVFLENDEMESAHIKMRYCKKEIKFWFENGGLLWRDEDNKSEEMALIMELYRTKPKTLKQLAAQALIRPHILAEVPDKTNFARYQRILRLCKANVLSSSLQVFLKQMIDPCYTETFDESILSEQGLRIVKELENWD